MSRNRKVYKDIEDSESLKDKGNSAFLSRDYMTAIQFYSAAIRLSPNTSILFSNRARCYYLLKDFNNSLKDSKKSIEIDTSNLKGHLLYVRSLGNISRQALDISSSLTALSSCNALIDKATEMNQLEYTPICKVIKKKIKTLIFLKKSENFNYKVSRVNSYYKDILKNEKHKKLFNKFVNEKPFIPVSDAFLCPISLEILSEPLITSYGNTYDSESLKSHFSKIGITDPITRQAVNPYQIYRNLNVIKAITWLKKTSPWTQFSETPMTSLDIEI